MKFFRNITLISISCTFYSTLCTILMPYIPPEIGFGIGGFESFNSTWQPLFEAIEMPQLNQCYEIDDIPRARYASSELRKCQTGEIVKAEDFPHRKKITVVHEAYNFTFDALKNSDYLIFMNSYQKEIAEIFAGIYKPCCVLPCHPIPFHLTAHLKNKARRKAVYIGGHFVGTKSNDLIERLEKLIHELDADEETAGATVLCYFIVAFAHMQDAYITFERNVSAHPLLKDRVVIIHNSERIPYLTMFENMAECTHTYLWRDEQTLDRMKELIRTRDAGITYHPIGESSMLANAVAAGCIPIVEKRYRFRAYFETDMTYSFEDFAKQLAEFIIKIDNESQKKQGA